jgi:hypothetical protein
MLKTCVFSTNICYIWKRYREIKQIIRVSPLQTSFLYALAITRTFTNFRLRLDACSVAREVMGEAYSGIVELIMFHRVLIFLLDQCHWIENFKSFLLVSCICSISNEYSLSNHHGNSMVDGRHQVNISRVQS